MRRRCRPGGAGGGCGGGAMGAPSGAASPLPWSRVAFALGRTVRYLATADNSGRQSELLGNAPDTLDPVQYLVDEGLIGMAGKGTTGARHGCIGSALYRLKPEQRLARLRTKWIGTGDGGRCRSSGTITNIKASTLSMMETAMTSDIGEIAKAVVRRNTEQVQGSGDWALFDELFADDFYDHTPQPGGTRDKAGVLAPARPFPTSPPKFTGSVPMETWLRPSRPITEPIKVISWVFPVLARR